MSSDLLRRCVDASLENANWMKLALWLKPSATLKCHASTMVYGSKTCASKALCIYMGKTIPTLPDRKPSVEIVCAMANAHGVDMRLLYDIGPDGALPQKCLMFGTVPAAEGGRSGARGCLIPVKNAGTGDLAATRAKMEQLLSNGVRKMTLIVFNPALYPEGHCICLRKVGTSKWYLSDPLMPAGTCLALPSKEALVLLMAGATTILGA